MEQKRGAWSSNLGFILAAAGSAVGLGNIWKYPRMVYNNGGGTFILVYLGIVLFFGTTLMITEFAIGRRVHKNTYGAFRAIDKRWSFVGVIYIVAAIVVLSYYGQVGGWMIKYFVGYLTESGTLFADPSLYLTENLLGATAFPVQASIIYPTIFMGLTGIVVAKGVSGGIEKANKVLMPLLFVMLAVLLFRGVTLPNSAESLKYLTRVDFSEITPQMFMLALGQAFLSLSLGMGIMPTYGSYLNKKENLEANVFRICCIDTAVSLFAAFSIIPISLAFSVEVTAGAGSAGFGFVGLASAFKSMPGGVLFGMLFYFLMFFAAITSSMSVLEGIVSPICEEFKLGRKKVIFIAVVFLIVAGIPYTLSQAHFDWKLPWLDALGVTPIIVGDWIEAVVDRLLLPLGCLMTTILIGWVVGPKLIKAEVEECGNKFRLYKPYVICIKFIAPVCILLILLQGFNIIRF